MAAGNHIFLDLTGPGGPVSGSCEDAQFAGKIELNSFSFTAAPVPRRRGNAKSPQLAAPSKTSKGKGKGKDDDDDDKPAKRTDDSITVNKAIDSSSPELLMYYCEHLTPGETGQEFTKAVVTFRIFRGGGTPMNLLVLTFTSLYLIDYQLDEVGTDTVHPSEKLTFSYKTCTIQYTAEPATVTAAAVPRSVTWDRTARQMTS